MLHGNSNKLEDLSVRNSTTMRSYLSLAFILDRMTCMPDSMCFLAAASGNFARSVLVSNTTETSRGCKVACGDLDECVAMSYAYPDCLLLGAPNTSMKCSKPSTQLFTKQDSGCPVRSNDLPVLTNEPDPCVTGYFLADVSLNQLKICPRNAKNYVIRGVDEFGERVTLDNDIYNLLRLNTSRNLWQFNYATTNFNRFFVSVGCAVSSGLCDCGTLPLIRPNLAGGVEAMTGVNGTCADPQHRLSFYALKYAPGSAAATYEADAANRMKITCEAGIWMLTFLDNSNGWQITNATCAP